MTQLWSWLPFARRGASEGAPAIGYGRPRSPLSERPQRSVFWISLALLALLSGFVVLLWRVGLFDFHQKVSDAKVFAAVLALVGGLFATSLTFAAALLKHSVDVRNLAHEREAEARLRLETSIRAVQLLTDEGQKATPTRQAGALFVLSSLDQLDFSLALLTEIWPDGDISPTAAIWVIDRALGSDDERIQVEAATLLAKNAARLTSGVRCFEWPACITRNWSNDMHISARERLLEALIKLMASQSADEWEDVCVNTLLVQFNCIRQIDKARYLRSGAAFCLELLLDSKFYADGVHSLRLPSGLLNVADLRTEVKATLAAAGGDISAQTRLAVEALRPSWTRKGTRVDTDAEPAAGSSTGVAAAKPEKC